MVIVKKVVMFFKENCEGVRIRMVNGRVKRRNFLSLIFWEITQQALYEDYKSEVREKTRYVSPGVWWWREDLRELGL